MIIVRVDAIDYEIAKRGWHRSAFAAALRTTPAYLSALMKGHLSPGLVMRTRMMRVLHKEFDDLFIMQPRKPDPPKRRRRGSLLIDMTPEVAGARK